MRTVTYRLVDLARAVIPLGFVGENQHTRILFDAKKVFDDYPSAVPSMTVQPPQGASYPAVVVRDGDIVMWDVSDSDLIHAGTGELQLAFIEDEVKVRTFIARTRIDRSIVPTGEIPEPLEDFLEEASAAVAAIPQEVADGVAEGFDAITAAAETLAPGSSATASFDNENKMLTIGVPEGERGQTGPAGADGFSPAASVSKSGDTATISITDKTGTTTATVKDGTDGQDGQPGADGYSPSASVSKSGATATITITDKSGTTTATVSDGADADPTTLIDDTSTAQNKVWSASKTSSEVSDLNTAFNTTLYKHSFSTEILKGKYIKTADGKSANDSAYCRTNLINGYSNRIGIDITNLNYVFRLSFYDATGNTSTGSGYLGSSGNMTAGLKYIPKAAVYIVITVRRTDSATISDSDVEAINASLVEYSSTDRTLSVSGNSADAKKTGEIKSALTDLYIKATFPSTVTLHIGETINTQGQTVSNSARARTNPMYIDSSNGYIKGIKTTGSVYQYQVCVYNSSEVFQKFVTDDWTTGEIYIPEEYTYYAFVVKRVDGANIASSEKESIFSAVSLLFETDITLTKDGKPADAEVVGARFASVESNVVSDEQKLDFNKFVKNVGYINTSGAEISDSQSGRTGFIRAKKGDIVIADANTAFRVYYYNDSFVYQSRTDSLSNGKRFVSSDGYVRIVANYIPVADVSDVEDLFSHITYVKQVTDWQYYSTPYGQPQFYLSDATATEETNINSMPLTDLYAIYDGLVSAYPKFIRRLTDLGMDATNTYEIREYEIGLDNPMVYEGEVSLHGDLDVEHLTNLWVTGMDNRLIGITTGIHGNEKAPTYGVALAIKEIIESDNPFATFIKTNYKIRLLPCVNPYGFANDTRKNGNNVDINRDFTSLSQSETVAYLNWMKTHATEMALLIDCHGTTGYYAYYEVRGDDPFYYNYCQQCMRFTTSIQKNWREFYGVDKYPFCYTVMGTYTGTKGIEQIKMGIPGFTLETPQNFGHGDVESWNNDLRSCKLTKDLLINAIQFSGEWAAKIKGCIK